MPDPYARVHCRNCGVVDLTQEEYVQQLNCPNRLWMCVLCGENASFDDEFFEEIHLPPEERT